MLQAHRHANQALADAGGLALVFRQFAMRGTGRMGQQGFGLVPYILTAAPDAPAKLDRGHVITLVKTYDQVAKEYVKQTTGLIV